MKLFAQVAIISMACSTSATFAQYSPLNVVSEKTAPAEAKAATLSPLGWMDQSRMEKEISAVNELAQTKIGTPIRRDLGDLDSLQRIINENLVARDDYETQQAMGVILGNLMIADFPRTLEWQIYEDSLGRSRAVCVKKTSECLFPVTMLSRRMVVGSKPDVKKIYSDALLLIEKHLPKLPYDGGIMYALPRPK